MEKELIEAVKYILQYIESTAISATVENECRRHLANIMGCKYVNVDKCGQYKA